MISALTLRLCLVLSGEGESFVKERVSEVTIMEDQWTTIDRKTSKKKTSREESKDEGEGWEQVGDTNLLMEII